MGGKPAIPFWDRVRKLGDDDCWPWLGCRDKAGYGHTSTNGKFKLAHRKAWELTNGPIPKEMDVLHHCDNPPCCNPNHLWLGKDLDNVRDCISKGRFNFLNLLNNGIGLPCEMNANAKLTKEEAIAIYIAVNRDGKSRREIAKYYGISMDHVGAIVRGRTWKKAMEGILR